MRLYDYVNMIGTNPDVWVEFYNQKILMMKKAEGNEATIGLYEKNIHNLGPEARYTLGVLAQSKFMFRLEGFMMQELWGPGPKIFRPTVEQLVALERMTLNIELRDFATPFKTICVELPEAYSNEKKDDEGNLAHISILHYDETQGLLVHDVLYGEYALKAWTCQPKETVLESWLDYEYTDDTKRSDIPTTEREYFLEQSIRRAVLNYCLLLDEVGVKKEGPDTPGRYAELVKWCQKKNKHTTKNKTELQRQGIVYGLAKKPTPLVRSVSDPNLLPAVASGRMVSPHSRRGYYRMQPFGPGRAERKRIRIPACIVNAHLLTGPCGGTYES